MDGWVGGWGLGTQVGGEGAEWLFDSNVYLCGGLDVWCLLGVCCGACCVLGVSIAMCRFVYVALWNGGSVVWTFGVVVVW